MPALASNWPRLAPHALVLGLVLLAASAGGFSRPDASLAAAVGSEHGDLTIYARNLLGARVADLQTRDSFIRPAVIATTQSPLLAQPRAEVSTYVLQSGDTIWDVGARFNVGMYSILWSNGLDEDAIVKPGQELRIPPVPGVLHTVAAGDSLDSIAKKFSVDPAVVVDYNGLRPGEPLAVDKVLIIPGGELPITRRPASPLALPNLPTLRAPAAPAIRPLTPLLPAIRPAPAPAAPTGRLSWPARGLITTYFSGYHPGIDIAAALGTPIGAADGGTVMSTGWDSTGYGYRVVVSHGNGFTTTYNHLSVILVRPGEVVGKGQTIARMGSTGRSSGSHLHFEILRNGSFVNPLGALN